MKTIVTLDKANQSYGFPQLNATGNLENIIAEGLTGTSVVLSGLTPLRLLTVLSSATDTKLLTIDDNGFVHFKTGTTSGGSALYWYAEPSSPPAVAPSVTSSNSIAIGDGAEANDMDMFVVGTSAGSGATNPQYSTFIGSYAGFKATLASQSNFFGSNAGYQASGANLSNFFGADAGAQASDANNSNFFGTSAGYQATNAYQSNFLGVDAGANATDAYRSNFIGYTAGANATLAYSSNFIGGGAGQYATNAYRSNFFGENTGTYATNANNSNFLGYQAGYQAINANNANFLGYQAGRQATDSHNSNFIGYQAGYLATNSDYSNFIGFQAGKAFGGNDILKNNIIIGTNISLPNASSNALNIGGVLFGKNLYSASTGNPSITAQTNGMIGIGIVSTAITNTLHVSATTDPVRFEGLEESNDESILTVDNTGVLHKANLVSQINKAVKAANLFNYYNFY